MVKVTFDYISNHINKKDRFWIAFTGDSITSCEWVHPNWREIVEYVLKEEVTLFLKGDWKTSEWGVRTFNFAYDGATTKDILDKVNTIGMIKPDVVISLMGGNDPTFNIGIGRHIKNINKIAKKLSEDYESIVYWCNSIPSKPDSGKKQIFEDYADADITDIDKNFANVVDTFGIYKKFPLEKFFTFKSEENPIEGLKEGDPDPDHPNQLGNAYIAKIILKEIFSIEFDPEKYWRETLGGEKFPSYK